MRIAVRILAALLLTFAATWSLGSALAAAGPLELTVYHSSECETCHTVEELILKPLQEAYGPALVFNRVEVSGSPGNMALLELEEQRLGKTGNPLPVIVYNDELIASTDVFEIEDALKELVQRELGAPQAILAVDETAPAVPTKVVPSVTPESADSGPPIHLAYIEQVGCSKCARARLLLDAFQKQYPQLEVSTFTAQEEGDLVKAMADHLNLPKRLHLVAPALYVGRDALVNEDITSTNLASLLERYSVTGAEAFWETLDPGKGLDSLREQFGRLGPLAIVLAALIDGLNPCAFATIIFFISYLVISQGRRRAMIAVGLAFTVGVFVAYLTVGLGALELITLMNRLTILRIVVYGALALSCFVLAGISFHDYTLAKRGKLQEMRLNLPDPLRERIKGRIRSTSRAFVGTAFVSGLIVSLLEFACTGQVYLPMITFMAGMPGIQRVEAIGYLVLYNVVFVVPLLIVLFLAAYGVGTSRFTGWLAKNAAKAKLITAILFVVLGLLLLNQALRRDAVSPQTQRETSTRALVSLSSDMQRLP